MKTAASKIPGLEEIFGRRTFAFFSRFFRRLARTGAVLPLAALHPITFDRKSGPAESSVFLPGLDLTLGRTTNESFPGGAQLSIIHTDLPWLQVSWIFIFF